MSPQDLDGASSDRRSRLKDKIGLIRRQKSQSVDLFNQPPSITICDIFKEAAPDSKVGKRRQALLSGPPPAIESWGPRGRLSLLGGGSSPSLMTSKSKDAQKRKKKPAANGPKRRSTGTFIDIASTLNQLRDATERTNLELPSDDVDAEQDFVIEGGEYLEEDDDEEDGIAADTAKPVRGRAQSLHDAKIINGSVGTRARSVSLSLKGSDSKCLGNDNSQKRGFMTAHRIVQAHIDRIGYMRSMGYGTKPERPPRDKLTNGERAALEQGLHGSFSTLPSAANNY